jgi:hypothetical protein
MLWYIDPVIGAENEDEGMMAGTSPAISGADEDIVFQDGEGFFNSGPEFSATLMMAPGTSPSLNSAGYAAFQGSNGDLWAGTSHSDQNQKMKAGTSPSVNDPSGINSDGQTGQIAFQANTGDLVTVGPDGNNDTGAKMMAGTSPSIDDNGDIAFQGSNGDLWLWIPGASRALRIFTWG